MISLHKYDDWEGTAEALAETAGRLMVGVAAFGEGEFTPNERLVRDYVARGIIAKPERRGKEAIFGFAQLVQFLACRAMLADGWPLSKIAQDFRHANFDETLALVPGEQRSNEALDLIQSFREAPIVKSENIMDSRLEIPVSPSVSFKLESSGDSRSPQFVERQKRSYGYRSDIGDALRRMGSDFSNAVKYDFTALQLATWLTLFIDRDRAAKITIDEAEAIGRAVTAGLLNQDSLTKDDVSGLAIDTVDELQRVKNERLALMEGLKKKRAETEVLNVKMKELLQGREQLEQVIQQMKKEAEMIDDELERKRRELKG